MQRAACFVLLLVIFVSAGQAADRAGRWRAIWHASQALLAGADTADVASSWGKTEGNPLLRAGQRFSYGSLAIKLGGLGGSLFAQRWILRKAPEQTAAMASANLAAAAVIGGIAARNVRVPRD